MKNEIAIQAKEQAFRLRTSVQASTALNRAADEIERLEARVAELEKEADYLRECLLKTEEKLGEYTPSFGGYTASTPACTSSSTPVHGGVSAGRLEAGEPSRNGGRR
jgi:hypothetical protein